jgi:hypothetical protein
MKKWMMKGGGHGSWGYGSKYVDEGWEEEDYGTESQPKTYTITAYVLYDELPWVNRRYNKKDNLYVPVCVIFVKPVRPLDEIYLVFNRKITAEDITLTVKLLLGIDAATKFQLKPPITIPETTSKSLLGDTFVKICRSGMLSLSYGIETGHYDSNTQLVTVDTTKHEIITQDKKYKSLDGKKIRESLADAGGNGFKNRVLTSKGVLADLYKGYFISQKIPGESIDENEVGTLFGKDLEPEKTPWDEKDTETYDNFKKRMMGLIRGELNDEKNHSTFGLEPETVEGLNQTRPLNITKPMSITFKEGRNAGYIMKTIQDNIPFKYTLYSEEWWTELENDYKTETLEFVSNRKKARVDYCIDNSRTEECMGPAWR